MQDDYIEEDFLEEENSSNRRPFLMAVGVLATLFILMGLCTAFFLINNRAAEDRNAEVAAIETRNAETEASNAATAIAATETAVAIPTEPPIPTEAPTDTPAPATLTPTSTPVVEDTTDEEAVIGTGDGDGDDEGEETDPAAEGTDETDAEAGSGDGDEVDEDATPTPISALSETGDGSNGEALPQTGLDTWGVILVAFVLVGLFVFARRLRTTS
jgi:hypothetical protein